MITANDTNPEPKELAGTYYRKRLPGPMAKTIFKSCVFYNYFHLYCRCEESHVSGVCTVGCGGYTAVFQRDSGEKTSRTADLSAQPNSTPAASG